MSFLRRQGSRVIMKPEKYCKKIVKDSGSNFYYSFFFLSKRKRRAIYAVYAFSRVIDDVVDDGVDLPSKERLISFWRSEINAVYDGYSEHPLTKELSFAVREFDIPKDYLVEHLNGVMQDMIQARYATYDDLKRYCYRVASIVGLICLKIFGVDDTIENREAAINLGLAFQLTNILRDVAVDADNDRIYLPEEDLMRFGLSGTDIIEGRYSNDFVKLMSFEWDRTNDLFERARAGFDKKAAGKLLPAMIMADIYYQILLKIRGVEYNVFENRVRIPGFDKVKIALKQALKFGN